MKTVMVLLGPGASGKSTLMQALVGADYYQAPDPVKCCYNSERNVAVPGTYKNGSDVISVMADRADLVTRLLADNKVQLIVLDGVRSSIRWDVDWLLVQTKARLVYVYFNLSEAENVKRLLARRKANGHEEMNVLPDKTYKNMLAFRRRAAGVHQAARLAVGKRGIFIEVTDKMLPAQVVKLVRSQI